MAFAFDGLIEYLKVVNARTFAVTLAHPFVYTLLKAVGLLPLLYLPMAPLIWNLLTIPILSTLGMKLMYGGAFIGVEGLLGIIHMRMSTDNRTAGNR